LSRIGAVQLTPRARVPWWDAGGGASLRRGACRRTCFVGTGAALAILCGHEAAGLLAAGARGDVQTAGAGAGRRTGCVDGSADRRGPRASWCASERLIRQAQTPARDDVQARGRRVVRSCIAKAKRGPRCRPPRRAQIVRCGHLGLDRRDARSHAIAAVREAVAPSAGWRSVRPTVGVA